MSDTKKKGHVRCAVDIPEVLNKRIVRFMEQHAHTGRVPQAKRHLVLECIKVGFEQIADEERDRKNT